ncbi:CheB methylesterase domain-containing protein [Thalassobaculum sp.]|uniref:CheB methylesterase domain-containing protein n=1 Tax=Thalassobaculum sp. TaxID=2022740 RepID=UPI0032F06314
MSRSSEILVIAADPLLRKAVTEKLIQLSDAGRVEAISPTRVARERLVASEIIVLAAFHDDLAALDAGIAAIVSANRATLLIAAGFQDEGRSVADRLKIPAQHVVAIPRLNVRDELARASRSLEAALKQARMPVWRPPERLSDKPAARPPESEKAGTRTRADEPSKDSGTPYLGPVICIGASTGGTDALLSVLSGMARYCPPIAIVQHMPEAYVDSFAQRLNQSCSIDVELARDNIALRPGLAVLGPGGRQFRLRKDGKGIWTKLGESDRIGGHCPSVDALMMSASKELGKRALGVILTGMGRDGAEGLLAMRRAGARTVAQDEATSVVYGMPKAAFEEGAADSVMPLSKIAGWLSGLTLTLSK